MGSVVEQMQSMPVHLLGQLLMPLGTLVGVPFLASWFAGPAVGRLKRVPPRPRLALYDPKQHSLPNEGVRWLDENVAVLRLEGFELLAAYVDEEDEVTVHRRLLEHKERQVLALVSWCTHWSTLYLRTPTARGVRLTTTTNGLYEDFQPSSYVREHFPGLDAKSLTSVHLALVDADGGPLEAGYREWDVSVSTSPLEWVCRTHASGIEACIAEGVLTPPMRDGTHRLRWRACARAMWKQIWPLRGRVQRARRRRARELLDAHGFAFPVVEGKHGKGGYARMLLGPVGGLTAVAMVLFTVYALVARRYDVASSRLTEEHACPCERVPVSAPTTLALFSKSADALAVAQTLSRDGASLVELPDALFLENASAKQLAELKRSRAIVVSDNGYSNVEVSCTAAAVEDARAIEREVRDYSEAEQIIALPPWLAQPTPEQVRARRTLRLLRAGLEDTAIQDALDERVVKLYASKPADDEPPSSDVRAFEEWRNAMAPLLGDGRPSIDDRRGAFVSVRGRAVSISSGTHHGPGDAMAIARYLCSKGCKDVRFKVYQDRLF